MTCSRAQNLLQLYIDQRLSLPRTRALERHLAQCPTCRSEWMLLEDVVAEVHSLSNVVEPPWLADAIMTSIAQTTAQAPSELPAAPHQRRRRASERGPFRPAARDLILSSLLATIVVLSFIFVQPALRNALVSSINPLVGTALTWLQFLLSPDGGLIGWFVWMLWMVLGICITLLLAGSEARSLWRQRIRGWLPQDWR